MASFLPAVEIEQVKKGAEELETVQRRTNATLRDLLIKTDEERLMLLWMFHLKKRELRVDMTVFQSIKGCHREEGMDLFSIMPEHRTRTNGWTFYRGRTKLGIGRNFMVMRVHEQWKNLSPVLTGALSLEVFKQRLGSHLCGMA